MTQTFEPTAEQRAVIDHRGRHVLVFAGPGTGKTETLARRFASIVHDDGAPPQSILVLTFSRHAAGSMRQRIVQRLRERSGGAIAVPELHVYTFHGFCARLLDADRPRGALRELLTPIKERLIWNRIIEDMQPETFGPEVVRSAAFANASLNCIARLKGDGITASEFARDAADDARVADIARLYTSMERERARLGLSDFRDFVVDAVRALRDPNSPATSWLRARPPFRHVLVDEFQDSDPMQLRLLEVLAGKGISTTPPVPEMCFVGDFNQSIYRFRGAEPKNIEEAKKRFSCVELTLRTNRRSVQAVLDIANRTPDLRSESLTTADPANDHAGSVQLLRAETMDDEVDAVADAVAARIEAGSAPGQIAVLLRALEPYRGAIVRELRARGIPVAAQASAGFREDSLIDAVLTGVGLIATPDEGALWRRLLTNPLVGFTPVSVSVGLGADRDGTHPLRALGDRPPSGRTAWADFSERFERCRSVAVKRARFDPPLLIETFARELDLLWPIRDAATDIPGFDPAASPARLRTLIEAARDIRQTSTQLGGKGMQAGAFLEEFARVEALLGDPFEGPTGGVEGVCVMSIHAAKGLEFDLVIIPDLVDGVLPARTRPDPLFGGRVSKHIRAVDDGTLEEASLWYVALTRARFDVLATYARLGDDAAEQSPSRYAALIGEAVAAPVTPAGRLEPAGFAAAYASASAAEREAASIVAYLAQRPILAASLSPDGLIDETRRPIALEVERLTPSGIEKYVACPRQWFYKEGLHLDADNDEVTRLGQFVHRVLEQYHRTHTDFASGAAGGLSIDAIMSELGPLAQAEAAHEAAMAGLDAQSPMFRYELGRIMRQLRSYAGWLVDEARDRPFTVVACEERLDITLGDVKLIGRVDRIDRTADGSLVIRDYKTGLFHGVWCANAMANAMERIDEAAPGIGLFGGAPDGLKLQTFLYVRGIEARFGAHVSRADYLYLAGEKGDDDHAIAIDSVEFVESKPADGSPQRNRTLLTRAELDAAYDIIAAAVAREATRAILTAFPTAVDDSTCRFCGYKAICPGPGTIPYASALVTAPASGTAPVVGQAQLAPGSASLTLLQERDDVVGQAKLAQMPLPLNGHSETEP